MSKRPAQSPDVLAKLDAIQSGAEQRIADKAAGTIRARAAAQGLSTEALNMRERRKRADVKEKEQKAIKARDVAMRRLAKAHPEEFLVMVQEERQALGLPVLVPRAKRPAQPSKPTRRPAAVRSEAPREPVVQPTVPLPVDEQKKCPHNQGLRKLTYGTFCVLCGVRIR